MKDSIYVSKNFLWGIVVVKELIYTLTKLM
jgi:hypothetical protein